MVSQKNFGNVTQCIISCVLVIVISTICYFSTAVIGYKIVALILLMTVSLTAMLFDIYPVLLTAFLSALIWNFFFIPPVFTFHIYNTEDSLMFLLYFIIALVNAVLTFKIRKEKRKARDKEEKEKSIKLYNTLLNSLSHELRTPISTIIGAIDILKENNDRISIKDQSELLNQIDIASMRLNRQVENLLNMSRLETGILKLNLDWCDTNELINAVILKTDFAEHSVEFIPNDNLPYFKYDRGMLEQVLQNLIHNAVYYTSKNTIIKIAVEHQFEKCIIEIADNGNGIPKEEMQFIFDKFYRLPNTKAGGTGLGLSIVKGIIEAHNGVVRVESNKPGGVKFIIEIPGEASYLNNLKYE